MSKDQTVISAFENNSFDSLVSFCRETPLGGHSAYAQMSGRSARTLACGVFNKVGFPAETSYNLEPEAPSYEEDTHH